MVNKRELLECLRFIRGHLYAATVQRSPRDDQIISQHVEAAYRRCVEVLREADSFETQTTARNPIAEQLRNAAGGNECSYFAQGAEEIGRLMFVVDAAKTFANDRSASSERALLEEVMKLESAQ